MARLSKKEQDLKSIQEFQKWFDRIDKWIKMLAVWVFGVSFVGYLSVLIAGFIHLIGVISRYEFGVWGQLSVIAMAIGLIATEFSAVYGVVYEELQTTNRSASKESKQFWEKLGLNSFTEFSMWFMAAITAFANFLYSLYMVKELQAVQGRKVGFVLLKDIIGENRIDDFFTIDPITLIAILSFSTIIPIIMIVQSKMQIQFLRFIMKTIRQINALQRNVEEKVIAEKDKKELENEIKKSNKAEKKFLSNDKDATIIDNNLVLNNQEGISSYSEKDKEAEKKYRLAIDNKEFDKESNQIDSKPVNKTSKKKGDNNNSKRYEEMRREPYYDDQEPFVDDTGLGPHMRNYEPSS